MARIRTIKPEFFRHEELQALGPISMLVFIGLWTQADKAGNFQWRPAQIKLDILPFIEYDVGSTLEVLRKSGVIHRYIGDDGKTYGHIPTFKTHQRFFGSEIKAEPKYPAFSDEKQDKEAPRKHQGTSLEVPRTVESGIRNQESGERDTRGFSKPASQSDVDRAQAVIDAYPMRAKKDGRVIRKDLHGQNILAARIAKNPNFPWEEAACLEGQSETPRDLHRWAESMPDPILLESLRKAAKATRPRHQTEPGEYLTDYEIAQAESEND